MPHVSATETDGFTESPRAALARSPLYKSLDEEITDVFLTRVGRLFGIDTNRLPAMVPAGARGGRCHGAPAFQS